MSEDYPLEITLAIAEDPRIYQNPQKAATALLEDYERTDINIPEEAQSQYSQGNYLGVIDALEEFAEVQKLPEIIENNSVEVQSGDSLLLKEEAANAFGKNGNLQDNIERVEEEFEGKYSFLFRITENGTREEIQRYPLGDGEEVEVLTWDELKEEEPQTRNELLEVYEGNGKERSSEKEGSEKEKVSRDEFGLRKLESS